jgi:hypothetical protein
MVEQMAVPVSKGSVANQPEAATVPADRGMMEAKDAAKT